MQTGHDRFRKLGFEFRADALQKLARIRKRNRRIEIARELVPDDIGVFHEKQSRHKERARRVAAREEMLWQNQKGDADGSPETEQDFLYAPAVPNKNAKYRKHRRERGKPKSRLR